MNKICFVVIINYYIIKSTLMKRTWYHITFYHLCNEIKSHGQADGFNIEILCPFVFTLNINNE